MEPLGWRRTKEEIIGVGAEASNLEDLDHIEELAMYVAYDCNGSGDVNNVAFLHQKLFGLGAYCFDDRFGK